jgi:hypothetical protein
MRRRNRPRPTSVRPFLNQLDGRCLLSSGLTPAQLTSAYGLSAISFTAASGATVTGDGSGETIALIEAYHDPSLVSGLHRFDHAYGLPDPHLTVINQAGSRTNRGWASEEALDVEWAHAIAPGANILVVEARSQSPQGLFAAVNRARNTPGVVAVSMSWGFSEVPDETSFDALFTTPAGHTGITFVAASGDSAAVEYPATSPNVLAVGGTSLLLSASGGYGAEAPWYAGGGGYSSVEPEPGYQLAIQSTGLRSTPDVAFDADPNTGVNVYGPSPSTFVRGSSWQVVGGTSLGAPAWAAIIAIADQGRALAGKSSLDGATQTLPALYSLPSSDFHPVDTASSWDGFGFTFGAFDPSSGSGGLSFWPWGGLGSESGTSAGAPGAANTATGLGTPDGGALVFGLAQSTLAAPLASSTGAGLGGYAPVERAEKGSIRSIPIGRSRIGNPSSVTQDHDVVEYGLIGIGRDAELAAKRVIHGCGEKDQQTDKCRENGDEDCMEPDIFDPV